MATITMEVPEDIMDFMVCENKCDELRRNAHKEKGLEKNSSPFVMLDPRFRGDDIRGVLPDPSLRSG